MTLFTLARSPAAHARGADAKSLGSLPAGNAPCNISKDTFAKIHRKSGLAMPAGLPSRRAVGIIKTLICEFPAIQSERLTL